MFFVDFSIFFDYLHVFYENPLKTSWEGRTTCQTTPPNHLPRFKRHLPRFKWPYHSSNGIYHGLNFRPEAWFWWNFKVILKLVHHSAKKVISIRISLIFDDFLRISIFLIIFLSFFVKKWFFNENYMCCFIFCCFSKIFLWFSHFLLKIVFFLYF